MGEARWGAKKAVVLAIWEAYRSSLTGPGHSGQLAIGGRTGVGGELGDGLFRSVSYGERVVAPARVRGGRRVCPQARGGVGVQRPHEVEERVDAMGMSLRRACGAPRGG